MHYVLQKIEDKNELENKSQKCWIFRKNLNESKNQLKQKHQTKARSTTTKTQSIPIEKWSAYKHNGCEVPVLSVDFIIMNMPKTKLIP